MLNYLQIFSWLVNIAIIDLLLHEVIRKSLNGFQISTMLVTWLANDQESRAAARLDGYIYFPIVGYT